MLFCSDILKTLSHFSESFILLFMVDRIADTQYGFQFVDASHVSTSDLVPLQLLLLN